MQTFETSYGVQPTKNTKYDRESNELGLMRRLEYSVADYFAKDLPMSCWECGQVFATKYSNACSICKVAEYSIATAVARKRVGSLDTNKNVNIYIQYSGSCAKGFYKSSFQSPG